MAMSVSQKYINNTLFHISLKRDSLMTYKPQDYEKNSGIHIITALIFATVCSI